MPSTSHPAPPITQVKVTSTLLYGIFVSQKSYLIGCRNLMKHEHAEMLANKVLGPRLPQELIDLVTEALYEIDRESVRSKWIPQRSCTERNVQKFEQGIYDGRAWRAASAKINSLGIITTNIQPTRPIRDPFSDPLYTTYIHLSCSTPSLALSLPSKQDPISPAIFYNAGNALVRTRLGRNEDETTYMPCVGTAEMYEEPNPVGRLVQCDGSEETMNLWDAERMRRFVELLDLTVIPFDEGEGDVTKPGLHFLQTIQGGGGETQ